MLADSNGTTLQNMNMTTLEALIQSKIDASKETIKAEAKEEAKLELYPVGSIYISTTNTNPETFIGGTWESYGEGRTLIGAGIGTDTNNESKSFIANSTGGEYMHRLSVQEMPSHGHNVYLNYSNTNITLDHDADVINSWVWKAKGSSVYQASYYGKAGGSQSHNNIQPYIVTYMWKRVS